MIQRKCLYAVGTQKLLNVAAGTLGIDIVPGWSIASPFNPSLLRTNPDLLSIFEL